MWKNYNKGLMQQIEEQTRQIEELSAENAKLRGENKGLREEIAQMREMATKTMAEIDRLKGQIGKNSGNSSKPPSQDGFKRVANAREKSGRARGGQKGHPGHSLKLPENLDERIKNGTVRYKVADHTDGAAFYAIRHVLDIAIETIVTAHRFPVGKVPPEFNSTVTYGNVTKTLAVLLSSEGMIAEGRLSDFFREISDGVIAPSEATIESFLSGFAKKLDPEIEAIKTCLLNGQVMHGDDTPMRCTQKLDYSEESATIREAEGKSFEIAFRTYSNQTATLYTVNPQKDDKGIRRDDLLPRYTGIFSHDHESKFYHYGSEHATCCAHLLRELRGMFELQKVPWADDMRWFFKEMNERKNADLAKGITACDAETLAGFDRDYDHLIQEGHAALAQLKENELGYNELRRMLARLTDFKHSYLLFIHDYRAPFTNNQAERDLRPCKTKQKISGCFRSWQGALRYAKIRSFFSTLKKRSSNLFLAAALLSSGKPVLVGAE